MLALGIGSVQAQFHFIENGGQWPDRVIYSTQIPGGRLYIESGGPVFNLYDTETTSRVFAGHYGGEPIPPPKKLKQHAYRLRLVGGSSDPSITARQVLPGKYAFFLGDDPDRWASDLSAFQEVWMEDVYPGVDLILYGRQNLKYDFIVAPGGQIEDITLEYEGVKPKLQKNGTIRIPTSIGEIIESKPFAYQNINGKIVPVECTYRLDGNRLSFEVGSYDTNEILTIDPELVFSTYSGSFADNFGYTATYDIQGHLYSGSTAFGTGYPMTMGAYQTDWAGGTGAGNLPGMDIAISKFSLDGTGLIYSTYLGGGGDEMPHSLVTDSSGTLYVFGTTGSSNFPVTNGAFQTTFKGGTAITLSGIGVQFANGCDMFVAKLSPTGQALEGATYIGGTANDGVNTAGVLKYNYADEIRGEIDIDHNGRVLVGSCTYSDDFPMAADGFQQTKAFGQDGVVIRLSPSLQSLEHSTFFGGAGQDAVYSIHTSPDGQVSVGGGTSSTDLEIPAGAFQSTYGGGSADGFIATFQEDLSGLETATYFGTASYDQIYFIEKDEAGYPHVFGQTKTEGNYFLVNASYGQPGRGMFVSKFSPDMTTMEWSTTFGVQLGVPALSPVAFAVDICNRIYLSGWGGSVNGFGGTFGLDITDDALQTTTDNNDFYFMVLSGDASALEFATYYGGSSSPEHVDGGTSRFDRNGHIYQAVCAGCGGNDDFPIYPPNALSPTNNSSNCNLGVAKIDFDMPLVFADFTVADVCLPDPVIFENTSNTFAGGNPTYHWDFGEGSISFEVSPTYTYENAGTYHVELVIIDPDACNITDTIVKSVTVYPAIEIAMADTMFSCLDSEFEITASTNGAADHFTWSSSPDFSTVISEGPTDSILTFSPTEEGFIYLWATSPECSAVDSVFLSPAPGLTLSLGDTLLCQTGTLDFTAIFTPPGLDPSSIAWEPAALVISGQNTTQVTVMADESFTLNVYVNTAFGCELTRQAEIEVHPIFLEVGNDTLTCTGDPVELVANSFGTADSFIWSANPNFSNPLNPSGDSTITVVPENYTRYYIRVENQGCVLIDSVGVSQLTAGTSITPDRLICAGDTATLIVSNDFPGHQLTHIWSPEDLILSGQGTEMIQAILTETTTFMVVSTTPQGCVVENMTTVFVSPLGNEEVIATANPYNLTLGESSQLSGLPINENYFYQWEPSTYLDDPHSTSPMSTPDETTIYKLTISDIGNEGICSVSDTVIVRVFESICGPPNIFVPNAFSPNGDGENDVLYVRGSVITDVEFSVFDRWGEKVFETDDISRGWDGLYKGKLAEPAVFVYYLHAVCGDGQTYFEKGNVTLIR